MGELGQKKESGPREVAGPKEELGPWKVMGLALQARLTSVLDLAFSSSNAYKASRDILRRSINDCPESRICSLVYETCLVGPAKVAAFLSTAPMCTEMSGPDVG